MITGRTRVAAVIGHPVDHSLSPALHNAGFASLRLDWVYVALDVADGRAADALHAVRVLGISGLSVTMPHKEAVAAAVDELHPAAASLRSVNTVVVGPDGRLIGHSTDGDGFLASLAAAGHVITDRRACVLGAGGAARAIIDALARGGAAEVAVVNRTVDRAHAAAALAGAAGRTGAATDVRDADLVINATSVGMGTADLPIDPALLHSDQVVADVVYRPRRTALLTAAAAAGARTVDGLGMLVHQAVLQQRLWTGCSPDPDVLRVAAERALAGDG